jgi:hypothetical protein
MRMLLPLLIACGPPVEVGAQRAPGDPVGSNGLDGSEPHESWGPTSDGGTVPYTMSGFSFVDDHAAGMPQPGRWVPLSDDLAFMSDLGITLLVTLTEEPLDATTLAVAGMDSLHLPIEDFQAPTLEQQRTFVSELRARAKADEKVGVHCLVGLGRTGTMLATWFVSNGMDAETAIAEVRLQRPGSIESIQQEDAVRAFDAFMAAEF